MHVPDRKLVSAGRTETSNLLGGKVFSQLLCGVSSAGLVDLGVLLVSSVSAAYEIYSRRLELLLRQLNE